MAPAWNCSGAWGNMKALDTEDRVALVSGWAICLAITVTLLVAGFNPLAPQYYGHNLMVYAAAWIFVIGGTLVILLARNRPASPIRYVIDEFLNPSRQIAFRRAAYYSVLLSVFGTLFSLSKRSIPLFNDYGWDLDLIALDRAIHGGNDAWLLIQPVFGVPIITWILGISYHVWVLLIYLGSFYFIFFEKDSGLRSRYIVSYMACWTLIGLVIAAIFASVGPCFAGPILGIDHFLPQMEYLHSVDAQYHLQVLDVQDKLLTWHRDETAALGAGIAAMPSMHVSQAFLFFLAMRHKPRWIAGVFGIFTVLILIGSVHLAYHYAVDGYVAIALTGIIWIATGAVFRLISKTSGVATVRRPEIGAGVGQPVG